MENLVCGGLGLIMPSGPAGPDPRKTRPLPPFAAGNENRHTFAGIFDVAATLRRFHFSLFFTFVGVFVEDFGSHYIYC